MCEDAIFFCGFHFGVFVSIDICFKSESKVAFIFVFSCEFLKFFDGIFLCVAFDFLIVVNRHIFRRRKVALPVLFPAFCLEFIPLWFLFHDFCVLHGVTAFMNDGFKGVKAHSWIEKQAFVNEYFFCVTSCHKHAITIPCRVFVQGDVDWLAVLFFGEFVLERLKNLVAFLWGEFDPFF